MSPPQTPTELIDLLRRSALVPEPVLQRYLERNWVVSRSAGELADLLVADRIISAFQAERLLAGNGPGYVSSQFKAIRRLGRSGRVGTYLCEDRTVCRRVVMMSLPHELYEDAADRERFRRAVRAVLHLAHPNLVRFDDIDQADNLYYLVMEYVEGLNLGQIVRERGRLPGLEAAHYGRQAALGLQAAFEAGLMHHDVRPSNLLVDDRQRLKIAELGLGRFIFDSLVDLAVRRDSGVLSVADYLSPEQALDGIHVDIRADIYSLGCTLYYCLAGWAPFSEGTIAQKLMAHQVRMPDLLREIRTDLPAGLEDVVRRMMAKNPADRYQTPAEAAAALAALPGFADYQPTAAPTPAWSADVAELAGALARGGDCAFALHDALLDHGHTELARHFQLPRRHHTCHCWVVEKILADRPER